MPFTVWGMWTPEEIAIEISRLERETYKRVQERNAKQQLGLAFKDLPETIAPTITSEDTHG